MKFIATCQRGYENYLSRELIELRNTKIKTTGDSFVTGTGELHSSVFAHYIAHKPFEITGESVNNIAGSIFDYFFNENKDIKFDSEWHCTFQHSKDTEGLSRRASTIKDAFKTIIQKRMSRVAKLASYGNPPEANYYKGLFVFVSDFKKVYAALTFIYNGQRRMSDNQNAPSRSYLKIEEAYSVLKHKPGKDDIVVDLGASPGGWSFSAAQCGATVYAIDNGELKDGALKNRKIIHYKTDAFNYKPDRRVDWLFCDMVEEPHHVLKLIEEWLYRKLCRFFIINIKFGHADVISIIQNLENYNSFLKESTGFSKIVHLFHDRDEITLVGIMK